MEDFTGRLCPHSEFCGGCVYQGIPYVEQLKQKENQVFALLQEENIHPEKVEPIEGCPAEARFQYRNKMEYTFGDLMKGGPLTLGMHRRKNFMSIETVDHCQLTDPDFNRILSYTLGFCVEKGYAKYHKKRHTGLLRNLLIRCGVRTKELLVSIVTSSDGVFDDKEWKDGLLSLSLSNTIVGISHTYNDRFADAVYCDRWENLYGRGYYREKISGLTFEVNLFSFFQTNVVAVERMYQEAVHLIPDFSGKKVFDLYCGTGTISQIMAESADSVLGIEIVQDSVDAAKRNAALNQITNCEFVCGDVFEVLSSRQDQADIIVCDPPRAGISGDAISKISSYHVPEILYISCNPKTLARDLRGFKMLGYEVSYLKPYDDFPMTKHVETVALMSRVRD
ncbi:MAG: 23S rRNA (uracil(1939)-C(5))-methyltransferase RlmD [Eubacteriales bacterium]|nr:23S rRNA (uracil(1939)-C(5))-methyltransferase RlmD [Eubacteriales bacterium]